MLDHGLRCNASEAFFVVRTVWQVLNDSLGTVLSGAMTSTFYSDQALRVMTQ